LVPLAKQNNLQLKGTAVAVPFVRGNMRVINYVCSDDNIDIKFILKNKLKISSGLITKLKHSRGIYLNGAESDVRQKCKKDDVLRLVFPYCSNPNITASSVKCDILYEDEDVICYNKPRGMPTHPSAGHREDTLANCAIGYLSETCDEFHVVTRLDRYTSGIVLAAKNSFSASKMCTKEYNSSISKKYIGVCRGILAPDCSIIELPIARCSDSIIKRCIDPNGKYSKTEYRVLDYTGQGNSLTEFILHTGRTHQIRVHMAHLSHPLVDDFLYDDLACNDQCFCLHCKELKFVHPLSEKTITVEAEIPHYFYSK